MRLSDQIKKAMQWVGTSLSNDPSVSNARMLQTFIVLNVVIIIWMVCWKSNWTMSDNVRLVLLTLITGGAGAYAVSKIGDRNAQP